MFVQPLDVLKAFSEEPPPLDFVWHGFLAGTVGALVSPGGTGKSWWALQAAVAVAAGPEFEEADLLELRPSGGGPVLYIAAEDPPEVLHHRLHALGAHLPPHVREIIAERLIIYCTLGVQFFVDDDVCLSALIERGTGARLIVLDTISRLHGQSENDNSAMAWLLARLEHVAQVTGAAVLYLHHTTKAAGRDHVTDQQAARGASALVDNARYCSWVRRLREDEAQKMGLQDHERYLMWGVSKCNYASFPEDRLLERTKGGVLRPATSTVFADGRATL